MIFLYDQTESSFSSMGRGPIADALSCKVSYSDSGAYELELEYPVNGPLHNYLVHRAIIYAKPNRVRGFQPFRIDEISRPTNGKIRYYAKHISYDLSGVPISAYTIEKTTDGTAMTQAVAGIASHAFIQSVSPFTFSTTKNSLKYRDTEFKLEEPSSAREVMDKINDTYKYGVWDFDGYNCVLYSTGEDNTDTGAVMGRDNGVVLYYGRDFIDATQESKFESMVSGIYPFWKSSSVSTQGSVASKLLSGLQAYINGDKNASSIAQDTGLSIERVKELITEYRNNNPHTVDLSFLAGETTSEPSTVSATDTHTGDGVTTTFTLGIKFKSISKVTIDDKNVGDAKYEYNAGYNSVTFTRETPANGSTIKIIGVVPELVELPEKVYAPSGYTPGYVKVVPVNLSSEFNSAPLESDLRQKAIEYWTENKLGTPEVSLSLTYKDIKRIAEYTNINCAEDLDLGDLVTVNFVNMGICEKVKITRIEYDPINDIYTALDLGEPKATLALTIVQAKQDIANKPDTNEVNQVTEDAVISMVTKYALSDSKDDCPQPVLDADGNDSVWQEVAPAPVSGKYLWRKTVTTYASGKVISDGHTCIDNGSSDNTTAISSSLAGTQTVYYVKTGSSAPSAPSGWVSSTSTVSNQWTTKIPDPIHNGHYYVCTQSRTNSGSVTNSAVVEDKNNTLLLSWTDNTSVTQINGGLIAANTVAASSIIAHSITADQLSTDAITSDNYEYVSGVYSRDGTKIDLATGYIRSKYFAVDQYGNAYLRGEVHTSNGSLGNFNIVGTTSTNYGSGLELYRSDAGTQWLAGVIAENRIALIDGLVNPSSFSVDRTDPNGVETRWFNNYYSMALESSGITLGSSGAQLLVNESPSGRRGILSGNWYTDANTTYTIEYRLATLEAGLDVNRHLFAVAKTAASSAFDSQAASITITSNFTDIAGNTVDISTLSIGDTFYVTDTGVPDRWVASKSNGSITLYVLETTRIPVTDVQVNGTSIVSNTIANITATTGDSNGQIKIAGQNISVKGLAALAYKNSVTTNDIDVTGGSANQVLAISGQAASWTTLGDLAWLNSITINKVTDAESWIANKNYITRSGIDATAPITYNSSNGKIGISLGSGLTTTGTPAQLILDTEYLDQNYVNNPMTKVGDLIVGGTGGEPTAISKGSAGQVLSSTANGLAWITLPADTNTWRDVGVNGESWKGTGINTGAIDFTDNTGIAITTGTGQNANKLYIGLANTYGDSKNPYGSKTAHYVLAAPSNQNGVPTFRVLDASDIPNLSYTKITGIGATTPMSYTGGIIALNYDDTKFTNDGGTLTLAESYYLASNPNNYISRSGISATGAIAYNSSTGVISVASGYIIPTSSSYKPSTWNAKQDSLGTATEGQVLFWHEGGPYWDSLPADTNTWRPVKYGSTTLNDTSTTLEFVAGTNIGLAFSSGKLTITNNYSYTLPLAANGTRGGIQIGYSPAANTKKYAVKLESEKAYVEVPWTDTTYSLTVGTGANVNKIILNQNGSELNKITVPYATAAGEATKDSDSNTIADYYGHALTVSGNTIGLKNAQDDDITGSFITVPYATNAGTAASASSVAWANVSGHADGVKADLAINGTSGSTSKYLSEKGDWVSLPSDVNTWRDIGVNGSQWKTTSTSSGAIDFTNDTGISITTGTGQNANKLYIGVDTTTVPLISSLGDLAWLDTITNAKITGGTSGYLLKSNGTSAASWVSPSTLTVSHAATAESIYDPEGQVTYTIEHSVPSDAVFTDTKVTQTPTTTSAVYEVLFSATASNSTLTETARKNNNLTFNPSTGNLSSVIYTMMVGTTAKASMQYNSTTDAIDFVFVA